MRKVIFSGALTMAAVLMFTGIAHADIEITVPGSYQSGTVETTTSTTGQTTTTTVKVTIDCIGITGTCYTVKGDGGIVAEPHVAVSTNPSPQYPQAPQIYQLGNLKSHKVNGGRSVTVLTR